MKSFPCNMLSYACFAAINTLFGPVRQFVPRTSLSLRQAARDAKKGFDKPLHNPYFDFDEEVLVLGAAVQAQAVTDFLLS